MFVTQLYRFGRTSVDRWVVGCGEGAANSALFSHDSPDGTPYSVFAPGSVARAVMDDACEG